MKILVCISHVPDTTTKIQFQEDSTSLKREGVTFVINPYDEFGLSRAIGFHEEGKKVNITVVAVGGREVEPTLRKALAIGANDAVRIDSPALDAASVAKEIAEYAREREYSIIFTGKESIDFNGSLVPGMIAETLDIPLVSYATEMTVNEEGDQATLKREVDGGFEIVETALPAVVSCQKGIAEWRIPNMRGIMAARKKPLTKVGGISEPHATETTGFAYPPSKGDTNYIDADAAENLISTLVDEGIISL